jgi:tight adherence protein B
VTVTQIAIVVFAAVFLLSLSLLLFAQERLTKRNRLLRRRLRAILEHRKEQEDAGFILLRDERISYIPFLHRLLSRLRFARNLQQLIDESGVPTKAGTLILGMLSLGGLVVLLVDARWHNPLLALIPGIVVGSIPYFWVVRRRRSRINRYEELLPEAIDLIVNALRSGFSLEASLNLVAQELPDPIGTEFAMTFEEQNLGLDLGQAFENLNRRVPCQDQIIMTTAIIIQKRTGGNLTEVLGKIAQMIRERFMLRREIRILTVQGRLSGMVLAVLPIVMVIVLSLINPGYMQVLIRDPVGPYFIGGAIVLQIIGFVVIRRIVRFDA